MGEDKSVVLYNDRGLRHGFCHAKYRTGKTLHMGFYIGGVEVGYLECFYYHTRNGKQKKYCLI